MTRRRFQAGDRVRLAVPTLSGWQGPGVVVENQPAADNLVFFLKDGEDPGPGGTDNASFAHWSELELIEATNEPTECNGG